VPAECCLDLGPSVLIIGLFYIDLRLIDFCSRIESLFRTSSYSEKAPPLPKIHRRKFWALADNPSRVHSVTKISFSDSLILGTGV
jgi:hypothetical protein